MEASDPLWEAGAEAGSDGGPPGTALKLPLSLFPRACIVRSAALRLAAAGRQQSPVGAGPFRKAISCRPTAPTYSKMSNIAARLYKHQSSPSLNPFKSTTFL